MGAETKWYVKVTKILTETIEVSAVTASEAQDMALFMKGVISADSPKHYLQVEEQSNEVYDD